MSRTAVATDIYNDGTYLARNPHWHAQDSEWKALHLFSLLDDRVLATMVRGGLAVAEIGCGLGGVLAELSRLLEGRGVACRSVGYDISAFAVTEAARRHPEIEFRLCDFLATHDRYDLGLMVDLLEHVEDPMAMLKDARKRLGWILLHIPLDDHLCGRALHPEGWYGYLEKDRGHIHYFTRARALNLLRSSGLRILRWKYTPWGIELYRPGGGRSASLVRVLRVVGMRIAPNVCVRVLGGASLACFCET